MNSSTDPSQTIQKERFRQIVEDGTFLVKEVGSSVHGTNLDGVDDLDLMGVCFQPTDYLLGLRRFEQYIYRSAEEKQQVNPARQPPSGPDDIDLVIYSVQKYLRLALAGNPTVLVFLFSPKRHFQYEIRNEGGWLLGNSFKELTTAIASKDAGPRFLGYLQAQKERLLGRRGQMRVTRKELVERYGYDTKYAMQACRLGLQGVEYMTTGQLELPMYKANADTLKAVRGGALTLSEVTEWIEQLEQDLESAIDSSELPEHPDVDKVNDWLAENQLVFFKWLKQQQGSDYKARLP